MLGVMLDPGQPRRRRAAAGRRAVPVEAHGHRLPEPARGAPAACRRFRALTRLAAPGVAVQGRGDRRARTSWCSTSAAHDRYRPECDLAYDNQLMVMLWSALATRDARLAAHALRRRRPAPPADRLGHLRALPRRHRLGGVRRGRRPRWAGRRSRTGGSSPTSTPAGSPARSPAARCSRRTRPPATPASPAAPPSLCGIEAALAAGDPAGLGRRGPAAASAVRGRLLLRRHPADLHGRRAGHAQRPAAGPTTRRRPATTGGCTGRAMDWAAAARRHDPRPWKGGCSGRSAALSRARARAARAALGRADRGHPPPGTAACWPTGGRTRAARRSCR